ncbi:MAG: alpha/beta hydrolase [Chitinophagaceae bacterium]|nr:alpha/beta hydrolase [Chitinophagaceae bacterium]MCA6452619.1 alpha/beta hydrolase [Chitinophagaceae bacterium]MCA6454765.1 alpha/beta hydrolase [Chitinophagaceae bacterium]MCA6459442.1 alpha/beta hydrolase [Chitinophagaceae bacterium]MCA6464754.1 alpha/beta hydrolase [Chitinophagaceae bacterium]
MRNVTSLLTAFLLMATAACSQPAAQKKPVYGSDPTAGKYYNIRGFNMYCEVYGEGEPLLIIHGNGGDISNFKENIPYFSKNYKTIIADSRGQGRSVDTGDSLSYEMMADDYAALLDALKIPSAHVIGWSDGGINGLLLALRHPDKVKKLAITGANLQPDTNAVYQEVWDLVTPTYTRLQKKPVKTPAEKAEWKLLRLLVEQPHIPVEALHKIECPTLVIGGDHDVIREEHTMLIYQNIPKAYLWILPNSGHSTPVVYKDAFNTTVDQFLKQPYRAIRGTDRFR